MGCAYEAKMFTILMSSAFAADDSSMTTATGAAIRWLEMPIEYVIAPDNDAELDEDGAIYSIVSSGSAWNAVEGADVDLHFSGSVDHATFEFDETNAVLFRSDWGLDPDMLAMTSVWSTPEGEALAFDLEINTRDHGWSLKGEDGMADLQNTVTHEFGHALGLGHLVDAPDATMYPSAPKGETTKRDLETVDINATLRAYSNGGIASEEVAGDAGSCNVGGVAPSWLALLIASCFRRKELPC